MGKAWRSLHNKSLVSFEAVTAQSTVEIVHETLKEGNLITDLLFVN